MNNLEKMRISEQELKLGLTILNMAKRYDKIGVFSSDPDYEHVKWTKYMFDYQTIGNATIEVDYEKNKKNPADYKMLILLNFKFNSKKNEILFRKTAINKFGKFTPVLEIYYCLAGDKYDAMRDSFYIKDGIATAERTLKKGVNDAVD